MPQNPELLKRLGGLNVFRRGNRRAPHKPLLLLSAIAGLQQGRKELSFNDLERTLVPLLDAYAPPVRQRHQPALPYWHLRNDGLWVVPGADSFEIKKGGFPAMQALRSSRGHLPESLADALLADEGFLRTAVQRLLDTYFPESLHDDILDAVGLKLPAPREMGESSQEYGRAIRRDPSFRHRVLTAYEHRCAVSGFRAALGGTYFGCEAAHVQWHAYDGPDIVENGLALDPTLHKLFDAGAWSLTDDRRVLVSKEFTGSDEALAKLRPFHGQPLRPPLAGESPVSHEYIRWHRDPNFGGVFRHPPLPL